MIEGSTADEWRLQVALFFDLLGAPVTAEGYDEAIAATLAVFGLPAGVVPLVVEEYPLSAYPSPALALGAVGTDVAFACPARRAAGLLSGRVPTFAYEFNDPAAPQVFLPPVSYPYGAYHASELQYLFGLQAPIPGQLVRSQERLAADMVSYWTRFARTGWPNSGDTPGWPRYTLRSELVQSLAPNATGPIDDFAVAHHCEFWRSLGL